MRRSLLVPIVCLAIASTSATCFAQAAAPAEKPAPPKAPSLPRLMASIPAPCIVPTLRMLQPRAVDMLAQQLKLSDADKTKARDLLTKADEAAATLVDAQRKAAQEFASILTKPDSKEADVKAAAEKAMAAEQAIMVEKVKSLYALKAILTPEQNKLLGDMMVASTFPWRPQTQEAPPQAVPGGPKPTETSK